MSFDEDIFGFDNMDDDDYSLESILAEYKGSAFIAGESRLSKDELEKQARAIIEEYTHVSAPETALSEIPGEVPEQVAAERTEAAPKKKVKPRRGEIVKKEPLPPKERKAKSGIEKGIREVEEKLQRVSEVEVKQSAMFSHRELTEDEQEFFGVGKYSRDVPDEELSADAEKTIKKERERRERKQKIKTKRAAEKVEDKEPVPHKELSPTDAQRVYGSGIESLRLRMIPVFILCIIMTYVTFASDKLVNLNAAISDGFLHNIVLGGGLLIVMLIALDIVVMGVMNPFRGKFGAETLAVASGVFALADVISQTVFGTVEFGAPYCAAAAFSIFGAMWGTLKGRKAFNLTFKMAAQTKVPTVVSAEWEKADEGAVITKNLGSAKGFVDKSTERDAAEAAYNRLAPILLAAAVVFAGVCARMNGKEAFVHCLSGLTAVTAAFGALMIFNQPFFVAVKSIFNHGAAIAGWKGACDMKRAVGMVVKDLDIFPENCMTLNGLKIVAPISEEKVIAYTGSLVVASGAGTSKIFAELMREYACSLYRVEEFSCYESGGIGAYIKGSKVWVGSSAFMNLMGIRLPQNLDIKNAIFSAIDGELAGVFIINYLPSDAVQSALINMLHSKITPIFAIRDFNVNPTLIRNKFKIPLAEGEFTTFAARYELSQSGEQNGVPAAIMSREGINHYAELVRCGRRIVSATKFALGITLAGTFIGMILMLLMFAGGSFVAASAAHLLTYMLLWAISGYLIATF
ncbi:MAG: hypothetical protein IKT47_00225 [Oscillospiraceae bacterium]|nr:hypothetical protein [Oscillospiraceae bacterium]